MELYLSKGRARSQQAHILVADSAQWLTLEFGLCPPYAHTLTQMCVFTLAQTHTKRKRKSIAKKQAWWPMPAIQHWSYGGRRTRGSRSLSVSQKLKVQPELQETLSELPYMWTIGIRKWSNFLKLVFFFKNGILIRSSTLSLNFSLHSKT